MIRIGHAFAEERRRKNLTLEEVAKATKIREEFLRAIEKGDFKALPSSAYAYGFVRNYAKFLGLHVERSLALFRREYDEKKNIEVLPRGLANPKEYSPSRFRIGRSLVLISGVFLAIVGFLFFQYRAAIFNPELEVDVPKENQTINSLTVEVSGKTDPNATLTVDSQVVPVGSDGRFKKSITVFPGNATISVKSENKFGRESSISRKITVKPGS